MNDRDIALRYLPHIYMDTREPFTLDGVGYTVLRASGESPSFKRVVTLEKGVAFCVEYAMYFDFDIQHLYDLEHIFVYVGEDGEVADIEASYHGKYLKSKINDLPVLRGTHPLLYCQPGKHAFLPAPEYFNVQPGLMTNCDIHAGDSGFLAAWTLDGRLTTDEETDRAVRAYIKRHFAFTPSMTFALRETPEAVVMPWPALKETMISRLGNWLRVIRAEEGARL